MICLMALAAPVPSAAVVIMINFDNLISGEVVDDDYPEAVFSSPDGPILAIALRATHSPPHAICTAPDGGPTCVSEIRVEFAGPVDKLTFWAVGARQVGVVARVEIISDGMVLGIEDIVSSSNGTITIPVDLTAYIGIDEITIFDVTDPAGLAFDTFAFRMPVFFDSFESGDLSLWSGVQISPPPAIVTVNFPPRIAGDYPAGDAAFGQPLTPGGKVGDLEYVNDGDDSGGDGSIRDACQPLLGFTPGRIALIDQGPCEFGTQVLNAEQAGAIAAIVVSNTGDDLITMEPGMDGPLVMISSAFLGQSDGDVIKAELGQTINVTIHANVPFTEGHP